MSRIARALACAALVVGALGATSEVIGRADGEQPGTRIEITQLKVVSGNLLSLQFTIINDSSAALGFNYDFMVPRGNVDKDIGTVSGAYLMDGPTKYAVLRDANGFCSCSEKQVSIKPGSRRPLWARFPAPPASVTKMTVTVPHFLPVEDVPIQRTPG
jgi:hypothetical protein